jgi:hypothetical protein
MLICLVVFSMFQPQSIRAQATPHSTPTVILFDKTRTKLHFELLPNGGAIDLTAKSPPNAKTEEELQALAQYISASLASGNFALQIFVEPVAPPNLPQLTKHKDDFAYQIEKVANTTRIRIATTDMVALQALHDFLRFEIVAHKTGDSMADPTRHYRPGDEDLGRDAQPGPEVPRPPRG